jgi:hypothetical protein
VRAYKTTAESIGLKTDLRSRCAVMLSSKVVRSRQERAQMTYNKQQGHHLKDQDKQLADLIREILCKLYLKHALNLFN